MGVRVAYGQKDNIASAIEAEIIPRDSIILTSDSEDSEMYFYDTNGNMKIVTERARFETLYEANMWVSKYDYSGKIISVHNGSDWVPYIVADNHSLQPISGGSGILDIKVIDGGSANGIQ